MLTLILVILAIIFPFAALFGYYGFVDWRNKRTTLKRWDKIIKSYEKRLNRAYKKMEV